MILIALSFVYILFTTVNFGVMMNVLFRTRSSDFATLSLSGLFGVCLFTSAWAVFGRVNWEFHFALFAVNALLFLLFGNGIIACYRGLCIEFAKVGWQLRLLFWLNVLLILANSAAAPQLADNESYYIQTVKWINEYGFVPGLANLHLFLAQCSGWHVAQSAFSFSFLYADFNDLGGFCLLLANLFALFRLREYWETAAPFSLVMGLLPVANVLLLQFSAAPSPDLAIYFLTFLICYHSIELSHANDTAAFNRVSILVLFALFIKVTAVTLVLFPLFFLLRRFRKLFSWRLCLLGVGVLALFMLRNAIVSGLPLFPLTASFGIRAEHALPGAVARFFFDQGLASSYGLTQEQFAQASVAQIFWKWLCQPGLHGLFNGLAVLLVAVSPVFILRFFDRPVIWLMYALMVFQLLLMMFLSPQYRFFLNFMLLFGLFCLASLLRRRSLVLTMLAFSWLMAAAAVFFPAGRMAFTSNPMMGGIDRFSLSETVFPHPNSSKTGHFRICKEGNLRYFSPEGQDFFWFTGNGPLPCVNESQLMWFRQQFGVRPQWISENPSDGFRAEP